MRDNQLGKMRDKHKIKQLDNLKDSLANSLIGNKQGNQLLSEGDFLYRQDSKDQEWHHPVQPTEQITIISKTEARVSFQKRT